MIEWNGAIIGVLQKLGFSQRWINLVMIVFPPYPIHSSLMGLLKGISIR